MADARSASGSIFSSFSTNSGGSSLADAGVVVVVVVLIEEAVVVADEEAVDVVLGGRVVETCCLSSSDGISPAADDLDAVVVDDVGATVVVKVDIDEEDVLVLLKVVDLRSNTKSGNDNLLEYDGPFEIGFEG